MNTEARQRVLGSNPLLRVPLIPLPALPSPPPPPPPTPRSLVGRASTHATVAPPPISDHPLTFRNCLAALPPPLPPVDLWTSGRVAHDPTTCARSIEIYVKRASTLDGSTSRLSRQTKMRQRMDTMGLIIGDINHNSSVLGCPVVRSIQRGLVEREGEFIPHFPSFLRVSLHFYTFPCVFWRLWNSLLFSVNFYSNGGKFILRFPFPRTCFCGIDFYLF